MCEANAYVMRNGEKVLLVESVDEVKTDDDMLHILNIFGDRKSIRGRVTEMRLVQHEILIEESED